MQFEQPAEPAKRLCELGFSVQEKSSESHEANLSLAASRASDREKFKALLSIDAQSATEDPFSELFKDTSIDPATGALLGRYIAEERDSDRRLRAACSALDDGDAKEQVLDDIARRLERLTETLEELKSLRS
jgi:hypothetical protein